MANTVNDVMNVIASPDYGIKNIAGTSQEILAILQGTHNSKNNIYNIVNDVKNLLQKLVDVNAKKKPVEIGGNNQTKINHRHIKDILDETKGIRKAIDILSKTLLKQGGKSMPAVAKLSSKASDKVAKAMIDSMNKQNKGGGGLSSIIDAFGKLKNISLKDILVGKQKIKILSKIFKNAAKDLKIDEKDLNSIIKLINSAPEMIKSLSKINWRLNKIIKNNIIKKLSDILIGKKSILTIANELQKNEKNFNDASKAAKSIKELVLSLKTAIKNIVFAALWSKLAIIGISSIKTMINNIIPLSNLLTKNKKNIDNGAKAAKNITVFIGNLFITSIFLTASVVTTIPAILGALLLNVMVKALMPIVKQLSRNNRNLNRAVKTAIVFAAFTGIMLLSSFFLTKIAKNAEGALVGSLVMLGVVAISVLTFNVLAKAKKNIIIGAIAMAVMSLSLILFGIALNKITQATKNASWKQFGMVAAFLGLFAASTALMGIPVVTAAIFLGSIAMAVMSISLLIFGEALNKISKATENLNIKQVKTVSKSMLILGGGISLLAPLSIPIGLGAVVLGVMSATLYKFVESIKIIHDMGGIDSKLVNQVLSAMKSVGDFFKKNALNTKVIRTARRYKRMMRPFGNTIKHLAKLKKLGEIPIGLVHQTLNAMGVIANYYASNPISRKTIRESRKYKRMMRPFGNTLKNLVKLKKLGEVPIGLVHQTLNAMSVIANYYASNPISRKTIRESRKYKRMMRPFGNTLKNLVKLKKLGEVPIGLVYQTLNAMSAIANYYADNPISRKTIRESRKYKRMMRPFGNTLRNLVKLKELGEVPIGLVYQTLNAMSAIANYYGSNPIKNKTIREARKYKRLLRPFGNTVGYLSKLKELGEVPMGLVNQALNAISAIANFYQNQKMGNWRKRLQASASRSVITSIVYSFGQAVNALKTLKDIESIPYGAISGVVSAISNIAWFYNNVSFKGNIHVKTIISEYAVKKFTDMAKNIQNGFDGLKQIDYKSLLSIIFTCRLIIKYYRYTRFTIDKQKILDMNDCVNLFIDSVNNIKSKLTELAYFNFKDIENIIPTFESIVEYYEDTKFTIDKQKILNINECVNLFADSTSYVKNKLSGFSKDNKNSVKYAVKSAEKVIDFLTDKWVYRWDKENVEYNLNLLKKSAEALSPLSNIKPFSLANVGNSLSKIFKEVKTIDVSQMKEATNMFNAFSGINKSESAITKFTESVKEFTKACKDLMVAMGNNTDAINNIDTSNNSESFISTNLKELSENPMGYLGINSNKYTNNRNGVVRIENVDEIAKTIAEKINGALSVDVPDTQVQLLINGTGGNEWTITRY